MIRPPETDLERVERAAAGLRPLERRVLILSAADGLNTDEIAAWLGISRLRAERLLASAIRKVDRALDRRRWWQFW